MTTKITADNIEQATLDELGSGPIIANVQIANSSYGVLDDTAVNTAGGYIIVNGSKFESNVNILIDGTPATSVTYVSQTQVRAEVPSANAGSKIVYLVNQATGATAIRINGLTYSGVPTWSTGSSLTEGSVDEAISIQLSATADSNVVYQLQTGSTLPSGLTLSANGLLTGTVSGINEDTIYNFTIEAVDTENQDSPRSFSITITAGDEYINSVVLALNADSNTFITDASTNSFTITPVGDTRPSAFSPYNTSWSNYFDGSEDYLTIPNNALFQLGTSDFTLETYVYPPTTISSIRTIHQFGAASVNNYSLISYALHVSSSGYVMFIGSNGSGEFVTLTSSVLLPINAWTHLAVIRSGSSFVLYQNGISVATGTSATSFHLPASPLFWTGRNHNSSPTDWLGYISNSRLIKGTALYTSNFTPPTTPLTAISGTSLLTCQSNRIIDNSTNNFTITINGDVKVTAFAPFADTDTSTGSGYFDGSGDYLTVNNFNGSLGAGNYTIEFWFNTNDINNFEFFAPTTSTAGPALIGVGSTQLSVQYEYGAGGGFSWTTGNVFDNNWHHLALVRNGTTVILYVDGISRASGTNSPVTNYSGVTTNWTLGFGNQGAGRIYQGYMSNFRVVAGTALYTSAFTPPTTPLTAIANTSLLTLQNRISYNNSQPIDESGIRNIITRAGNASVGSYTPHTPAGWSAYFDGSSSLTYAVSPISTSQSNFTIEAWVYPTTNPTFGGGVGQVVVDASGTAGGSYWGFGLTTSRNVVWRWYDGASGFNTTSVGIVPLNTWSHITVSVTSNSIKLFINGTLQSITGTSTLTNRAGNIGSVNIGRYATTDSFYGYISNVSLIVGTGLYTSTFTPSTTPLEPIAGTSLLTLRGPNFTDDGPNRFAITRNGDTRITAFSPFKTHTITPDSHSVFFDGSGDYLSTASNAAFALGTGNFTVECWLYINALPGNVSGIVDTGASVNGNRFSLVLYSTGKIYIDNNTNLLISTLSLSTNQWYHIAAVRSGTGTNQTALYINGVQDKVATVTADFSNNNLRVGSTIDNLSLNGYISNARIVKGTAVYTSAFTPSTAPLTNIANTSLLTCQSPTVIDNSNNAFAITVNGNSQPTRFNPFGETVTEGIQYSPASHGGSYYFDGTGDYLTVPDSVDTELGSGNFTIELWFYANQITAGTQLLGKDWWTPFYFEGSNLVTYLSSNGSTWDIASNQVIITSPYPRTWYHVAMVRNGTSIRAYVNGALSLSLTSSAALYDGNYPLTIARRGTTDFNGYISNIRIVKGTALYTSAFVPPAAPPLPVAGTTLLLNGTNAAIADGVGKNVLETVGNARIINGIKKYGTGSMYFDGTGDYVVVPASPNLKLGSGDFTIECWLNRSAASSVQAAILQMSSGTDSYSLLFGYTSGANLVIYTSSAGSSWDIASAQTLGTVQNGTWVHYALTRSGSTFRAFQNGIQQSTWTSSANIYQATDQVSVAFAQNTHQLAGYIDDLRITKGIARYTANFTPPTSSFKLK